MGYFSEKAIDFYSIDREDCGILPDKERLLMRLDDLNSRLIEMNDAGVTYNSGYRFSEDELKYVLPKDFCDICNIERAIDIIKWDLMINYGTNLYDTEDMAESDNTDETIINAVLNEEDMEKYKQLTLFDIIPENLNFVGIAA